MSVRVLFECGGCDAKAEGTDRLKREFRSFSGRRCGVGGSVDVNSIDDVTPKGWVAFDPYTYATYCPDCWADIIEEKSPAEDDYPLCGYPDGGPA